MGIAYVPWRAWIRLSARTPLKLTSGILRPPMAYRESVQPSRGPTLSTAIELSSTEPPHGHEKPPLRPPPPANETGSPAPTTADDPALTQHRDAVERIASQVRAFHVRKTPFRIHHGSTNSTRPRHPPGSATIDTSALSHVLRVDTAARTALVEPNVPMDRLVEATLLRGLVPPVVTEFPGITAGGAYAGTAGESSSFRHGYFNETLAKVEMVLADGTVVEASRTERPDLFFGAAGAVGTLGVTTAVEIALVPAKKYVVAEYHPVQSMEEATAKIAECVKQDGLDYVDGMLFSATQGAVVTGRLADSAPNDAGVQRFSGAGDPWFFLHVQDLLFPSSLSPTPSSPLPPVTEAIRLPEYLFRYDRGGFWVGLEAFAYFRGLVPFARWTRRLLDDFLHTRMMYAALHASGRAARFVVQDLALPFATAPDFVRWADKATGIYPLWLCPLRSRGGPTLHPHALRASVASGTEGKEGLKGDMEEEGQGKEEMLLNIGLWGPGPMKRADFVALNRAIEAKLVELRGTKWLYAHAYYSEDEFWSIYDQSWYETLRSKYGATGLPSVWEKVRIKDDEKERIEWRSWKGWLKERWPVAGLWGVWKAIRTGSYKEARASAWKSM